MVIVLAAYIGIRAYNQNQVEETTKEPLYSVVDMDCNTVNQLAIMNEEGTFDFEKDGDSWNYLEDTIQEMDATSIDSMISVAASLESETQITEVTDMAQYGLDEPEKSITLQSEDSMYQIKLGDYNQTTGEYYLSINDETTVYTISTSVYDLLNKSLTDFIAEEETTTEASTADVE